MKASGKLYSSYQKVEVAMPEPYKALQVDEL